VESEHDTATTTRTLGPCFVSRFGFSLQIQIPIEVCDPRLKGRIGDAAGYYLAVAAAAASPGGLEPMAGGYAQASAVTGAVAAAFGSSSESVVDAQAAIAFAAASRRAHLYPIAEQNRDGNADGYTEEDMEMEETLMSGKRSRGGGGIDEDGEYARPGKRTKCPTISFDTNRDDNVSLLSLPVMDGNRLSRLDSRERPFK
jgi:hypothetical protein